MSRITQTFKRLKQEERIALIGYITAGNPDLERSFEIVDAACGAGLDLLEFGIPFSDPFADGPVLQRAAQRAIESGMTLEKGLQFIRRLRERHDLPIIIFSYYPPIPAMGTERFVTEAINAGADGALIVDLPNESTDEMTQVAKQRKGFHLIKLIPPTMQPLQKSKVLRQADGFVYCISRQGVTGTNAVNNTINWDELSQSVATMRMETNVPLCVGFGISAPDDVRKVAKIADGVIIGSAFQKLIENNPDEAKVAIAQLIRECKKASYKVCCGDEKRAHLLRRGPLR
jgi:tryptophan synthase, alpha subunit